ncbi:uncharacterized protein LOC135810816 isoform X2 [Sycon ciliatum]|uniref:uncharacterized protein LOC135810816 isoform X2 n=1 Tax=Sycon ciliatum TaxID=27933 RepID=UPI0020A9640D
MEGHHKVQGSYSKLKMYKAMMGRLDGITSQLNDVKGMLVDLSMRSHLLNVDTLTLISPESLDIVETGLSQCAEAENRIKSLLQARVTNAAVAATAIQS